jgi:hypothetical protein
MAMRLATLLTKVSLAAQSMLRCSPPEAFWGRCFGVDACEVPEAVGVVLAPRGFVT